MISENSSNSTRDLPAHLKVPWKIWDAVVVYIVPWIILPLIVYVGLFLVSPYVPVLHSFYESLRSNSAQANFILVLINGAFELGIVAYYVRKYNLGWKNVGWRKFNFLQALGLLLLMLIIFSIGVGLLTAIVSYLLPAFNADQAQINEFTTQTLTHPSISLLALVIIPPIIEETIFRGFIFPAFSQKFGLVFGAIVTSVLFGFAHLQANVSVYTFALGLVLCFMYVRLKSIFPGMALHMLNNYLAFIAIGSK